MSHPNKELYEQIRKGLVEGENYYEAMLTNMANIVHHYVVVPYCNEHICRFLSVNGDYWFVPNGGAMRDAITPPQHIVDLLSTEIYSGRQELGSVVESYTPEGFKHKERFGSQ